MGSKSAELLKSEQEYQTKVYDDFEAGQQLQMIPSRLLGQVIRGEIDLNALAKIELANRGQDTEGKWIGFEAAAALYNVSQ